MPLELNIKKNFLWSKVKCTWAVHEKICFKHTWNETKKRILWKKLHYQPFVAKSVSFSECKKFLNTAMQKNINQKQNTPIKSPPHKRSNFFHQKEVKEKMCLIFVIYVWTTFVDKSYTCMQLKCSALFPSSQTINIFLHHWGLHRAGALGDSNENNQNTNIMVDEEKQQKTVNKKK